MQTDSAPKPASSAKKATARSAVSNGNSLGEMDGRSKWARRLRDLIELYSSDLTATGELSNMQRSLVRRAATLTVELERAEDEFAAAGMANGDALNRYQTACNTLKRLLESLGVQHQVKDAADVQEAIEADRAMRRIVDTPLNWGVAFGNGKPTNYDLATRFNFVIERAKAEGSPIPAALADLAVELGLAAYEDLNVMERSDPT